MDVEKTMQFIIEQHAAFSADLVELGEHVKMLATTAEHMLTVQQEHETWLARLTEAQTRLAESEARLAESNARLAESHARLSDKQDRNEDAINVLIRMYQDILPRLPKQ